MLLSAFVGAGCSGADSASTTATEAEVSTSGALRLSPAADPELHIALALLPKSGARASVQLTVSRGAKRATMGCDNLSAGGNIARGEQLFCELSQGRDEEDVHEDLVIALDHDVLGGEDVYTLARAMHAFEGTDYTKIIDIVFPDWREKPFQPETLTRTSRGDAAKDPFALANGIQTLVTAATAGLMVPDDPARISTAPGVKQPPGPGPYPVSEPGFALWGDYSASFIFTIEEGVWFNVADGLSVFAKAGDPSSGLATPQALRARIEADIGK